MSNQPASETILTVEKREDGEYYVMFDGREFVLASPISLEQRYVVEAGYWLNDIRFSAIRSEELGR